MAQPRHSHWQVWQPLAPDLVIVTNTGDEGRRVEQLDPQDYIALAAVSQNEIQCTAFKGQKSLHGFFITCFAFFVRRS